MTGVKFLLRVTLRRHDLAAEIYHLPEPQRLPLTMSPDEAEQLLAMTGSLRDQVMLSLGYGCGLRASESVRLRTGDIDSAQMIIRIVQSKGRKDRHVMLPPELLRPLRQWWKARARHVSTRHCQWSLGPHFRREPRAFGASLCDLGAKPLGLAKLMPLLSTLANLNPPSQKALSQNI